jgi:hypothetical protein
MVPLALFSQLVPAAERRALADRLLAIKPLTASLKPVQRYGTGFDKPAFPPEVTESTTMADWSVQTRGTQYTFYKLTPVSFLKTQICGRMILHTRHRRLMFLLSTSLMTVQSVELNSAQTFCQPQKAKSIIRTCFK